MATAVAGLFIIVGLVALLAAIRGRRTRSDPACRRCRADLRGFGTHATTCPECGTSLERRRAVRFRERRRRIGRILATLLFFGAASIAWATLPGNVKGPPAARARNPLQIDGSTPNETLVSNAVTASRFLNYWDEVSRRVSSGQLPVEKFTEIIVASSSDTIGLRDVAWNVVLGALASRQLSLAEFEDLCEALYGATPRVELSKAGPGRYLIRIKHATWGPRIRMLVYRTEIAGRPADVRPGRDSIRSGLGSVTVWVDGDLPLGDTEVVVDVAWGVDLVGGRFGSQEPPQLWMKRETLVVPVVVE